MDRSDDCRPLKVLVVLDEWSRECVAIHVARPIRATDVLGVFADLMPVHGAPKHIRSDDGPEMVAETLPGWLGHVGAGTLHISPGSQCKSDYGESLHGKLHDELLNRERFATRYKALVLVERWRGPYTRARPYSALGYRPPAPEFIMPRPPEPDRMSPLPMA